MAINTGPKMTAGEVLEWIDRPENAGKRWDLFRGVAAELPVWPHAFRAVHMRVVEVFGDYVIGRGSGSVAFLADGLITARNPDTVRRPAAMVFLDTPGTDFPPRFTAEVPRVVIELVRADESGSLQLRRAGDYVRHGAEIVRAVNPERRACLNTDRRTIQ